MKLVKDKAAGRKGCFYLYPGLEPVALDGAAGVRAFILGPPERAELHRRRGSARRRGLPGTTARRSRSPRPRRPPTRRGDSGERSSPFRRHYSIPREYAFDDARRRVLPAHYGNDTAPTTTATGSRVAGDRRLAAHRRTSGSTRPRTLALKLNTGINNTSLVLAFELAQSKKVLFFAADAQRGNWMSWKDLQLPGRRRRRSRRRRSAGPHGALQGRPPRQPQRHAHGTASRRQPNLAWMGRGRRRRSSPP